MQHGTQDDYRRLRNRSSWDQAADFTIKCVIDWRKRPLRVCGGAMFKGCFTSVHAHRTDVSQNWQAVFERVFQPEPTQRIGSARIFLAELLLNTDAVAQRLDGVLGVRNVSTSVEFVNFRRDFLSLYIKDAGPMLLTPALDLANGNFARFEVQRRRPADSCFDVQRSTERSFSGNDVCSSPIRP
jgi:hypothetical protein